MTAFRDRIDAISVRTCSLDGAVTVALADRTRVTLSFAPGWYQRCSDDEIARRLGLLAPLLWAARMRKYREVVGAGGAEPRPVGHREVAYREARDALVARGSSAADRVSIAVAGMRHWTVRVRPGTVRDLDERQFAGAVADAAGNLILDQYRKVAALKLETFG